MPGRLPKHDVTMNEINEALLLVGGHLGAASRLLGVEEWTIRNAVNLWEGLARWRKPEARTRRLKFRLTPTPFSERRAERDFLRRWFGDWQFAKLLETVGREDARTALEDY